MADRKSEPLIDGKALSSLRVVDLKQELEKRGISKSGSKKELIDRLRMRLELESMQNQQTVQGVTNPDPQSVTTADVNEPNEFVKLYLEERQQAIQKQLEIREQVMSESALVQAVAPAANLESMPPREVDKPPEDICQPEVSVPPTEPSKHSSIIHTADVPLAPSSVEPPVITETTSLVPQNKNETIHEAEAANVPLKIPQKVTEGPPIDTEKESKEDQHITPTTESHMTTSDSRRSSLKSEEKNGQKPKRRWGGGQSRERQAIRGISSSELNSLLPMKEKVSAVSVEADSGQGQVEEMSENVSMTTSTLSASHPPSGPVVQKEVEIEKEVPESGKEPPTTNGDSKEPTPPRNPPSQVIFVENLTRPFTLMALQSLFKKYGQINTERFWIDKIKSKCLVTYLSIEEATQAQAALQGLRWPDSNPKTLSADFANDEDIDLKKKADEAPAIVPPPKVDPTRRSSKEDVIKKTIENDKVGEKASKRPLREWDKDKVNQSPAKKRRSRSPDDRKKTGVESMEESESPAKLLDDLFKKTSSTPVIYWLPLTEEEAEKKLKEREEREKRRVEERARFEEERKSRLTRRSSERKERSPPRPKGHPMAEKRRSPSPVRRGRRSPSYSSSSSRSPSPGRRIPPRNRSPPRRSPPRRR